MRRSCNTCRERRKGCDKTKPTCRTCFKDGLKCGGYAAIKHAVFVHSDAKNIDLSRRKLLLQSLKKTTPIYKVEESPKDVEGQVTKGTPAEGSTYFRIYRNSINCLDLTEVDFQDHLKMLWNHFDLVHSRSSDAWVPSFTPLISGNCYLDLALIALSTLRFSQMTKDHRIRAMSLTAYGKSLRIFRHIRSKDLVEPHVLARLATTALVYTLFEATHYTPYTIFTGGVLFNNIHLRGAMTLVQLSGPQAFADEANLLVFKKMREMIILDGFCNYKRSFLAEPKWMNKPWNVTPKTNRDRLFDVAAKMTRLIPSTLAPNAPRAITEPAASSTDQQDDLAATYEELEAQLSSWEESWLESLSAESRSFVYELRRDPSSVQNDSFKVDVVYLQLELWAFQIFLALCSAQGISLGNPIKQGVGYKCMAKIAERIRLTLELPVFRPYGSRDEGIIEGQCRSLFPAWSLLEHERCTRRAALHS